MPEEMEVQTESVHERVNESVERKDDWLLKAIALTTALLAILATIAALRGAGAQPKLVDGGFQGIFGFFFNNSSSADVSGAHLRTR